MTPRTIILTLALATATLLVPTSCQRRPLTDLVSDVKVNILFDRDIVNYTMENDPSLMRIIFYNSESGNFASQAFTSSVGDYVNVVPGRKYDVLAYNFDTENTVISEESKRDLIFATTNTVPESYRSRLRTRASKDPNELIVFEPDHLFSGHIHDVHVVSRGTDAPETVVDVEVKTVVESWVLEVDKIHGIEWVASVYGVISGLSRSTVLTSRESDETTVSVFIEPSHIDVDGKITVRFNTFGYNPAYRQEVSLVITDTGGKGHVINFDVSDQFRDEENIHQTLIVKTDQIVIEEPEKTETGGGGVAPEVDRWDDVNVDIII